MNEFTFLVFGLGFFLFVIHWCTRRDREDQDAALIRILAARQGDHSNTTPPKK